ncbi:MAG: hypothetical protein HC867_06975, partial [Bacteroidia bacterium]|nr:hypothetical protein [Bacteroidia bacterium]
MKKQFITRNNIIGVFVIAVLSLQCSLKNKPVNSINKLQFSCNEFFVLTKEYWKGDSLCLNGFRFAAIDKIINKCRLEGRSWNDYTSYFGKARRTLVGSEYVLYYYQISNFAKSNIATGQFFLIIKVDKNDV